MLFLLKTTYTVELHPETWYVLKVTARSSAGSTECILKFGTKSYFGATIEPLRLVHRFETPFYENIYIMVPLAVVSISFIVVIVAVGLYCHRRRLRKRHKASSVVKLHQDAKTALSLLSDTEKPIPAGAEKSRDTQTYVAVPGLSTNILKLVPQTSMDAADNEDDDASFRERTMSTDELDIGLTSRVRVEAEGSSQDGSGTSARDSAYSCAKMCMAISRNLIDLNWPLTNVDLACPAKVTIPVLLITAV